MLVIKNIVKNIVLGALILIPIIIFIHFTYSYFSNYSPIPSIVYFYASMKLAPLYLLVTFYLCGLLAKFFSQNLTFNSID